MSEQPDQHGPDTGLRPSGPRVPSEHGHPSPSSPEGKRRAQETAQVRQAALALQQAVQTPVQVTTPEPVEPAEPVELEGEASPAQTPLAPAEPPQPAPTEPQAPPSASQAPPPITDEEFEEMVADALDRVPPQFLEAVENLAFMVEHDAPGGQRNLLGLYHGVPLTGRGHYAGAMPDTITIYQNPIVRIYKTRERVREEVYRTVVHEIGHYFGMDDDELHGLGW